ncbi:MAG: DEAD/DEAH box helicase [Gammaproteobacteria bacterium]|nr:DEAD/DEAH box helicase [Gammaproteobacteria bacterium]
MSFSNLGLRAELLRAVADQGYSEPTPVQLQAIPAILAGRDILAGAQTGTGKTAGFTLPILQCLAANPHDKGRRPVRALILTPTRELAAQVRESVAIYGRHMPLRSTAVFGGVNIKQQIDNLRRGVDILVATPGRLQDHVNQRTVDLSAVEILVLDEADRMLDMGFLPAIRRILAILPKRRQNLLFSATFPKEIRSLAEGLLHNPEIIEIARIGSSAEGVSHTVHPVDRARKRELLAHLIDSNNWSQVLVFTKMKHGAERLAKQLDREGMRATSIHGNKNQNQRTRALQAFKSGAVRVLVATDVASRGLDIEQLPHVVNFELPLDAETYIHRIGRTGRAGKTGEAVSLVDHEEREMLSGIEQLLKRTIPQIVVPGFEPGPRSPSPSSKAGQHAHRAGRSHGGRNSQSRQHRRPGRRGGNAGNSRGHTH